MSDHEEHLKFHVMKWTQTFNVKAEDLPKWEIKAPWRTRLKYWVRLSRPPVCYETILDRMELVRKHIQEQAALSIFDNGFST